MEERAGLEKEKQELAAQKKLLLQERESFTEAAVRLNREVNTFVLIRLDTSLISY